MNSPIPLPIISQPSESLKSLTRREALSRLAAAIGATFATHLVAEVHPVVRHLSMLGSAQANPAADDANWSPQFLNVDQNDVLVGISDMMLPGAGAAHVNRTIDLLMTVETDENRKLLTQALVALDAQAEKQFHSGVTKLSPDQVDELLSFCSEQEPPHAEHDDDSAGWKLNQRTPLTGPPNLRDHFELLKGWIVASYYSSEAGLRELGWDGANYYESPAECEHTEGHQ
jgi:hypothetical protein